MQIDLQRVSSGCMPRHNALPANLPPRGLGREAAAQYVGVSPSTFDKMVGDGRMPYPKQINTRRIWDRHQLDRSFDALPEMAGGSGEDGLNPWDNILT